MGFIFDDEVEKRRYTWVTPEPSGIKFPPILVVIGLVGALGIGIFLWAMHATT